MNGFKNFIIYVFYNKYIMLALIICSIGSIINFILDYTMSFSPLSLGWQRYVSGITLFAVYFPFIRIILNFCSETEEIGRKKYKF